jgi:hypothetical protein
VTFTLDRKSLNSDVSTSWTNGRHKTLFGMWTGSDTNEHNTQVVADNEFNVALSFGHALLFQASPGLWYSSAAMNAAYGSKSIPPDNPVPPWRTNSFGIDWAHSFDENSGNLTRFLVNLVVVDAVSLALTSSAKFDNDAQDEIRRHSAGGVWPFYRAHTDRTTTTNINFDDDKAMTIKMTTAPGVPIVIGGNVLKVDRFLGHARTGARLGAELSGKEEASVSIS